MAESPIRLLPEQEALNRIVQTVEQAEPGAAPFALVLGSGFSHGLVPTAKELVAESLPLWVLSLNGDQSFETLKQQTVEQRADVARAFWRKFTDDNVDLGLSLPLDSHTGLPENSSAAYKASFDPAYGGAVGEPAQARRFQRALMRLDQPRLNAAHFLLASLIGVQPGKTRANPLFKAQAAFCRLILTTNFDPFLQTALQAVNRLYFMSDTPELGVSDEILDDHTDAIHLVYLHGSIHRRSQAATDQDIKELKEKNARTLAPVLKRRGVIVLGYSGWDDALVEALAACDRFDHRLYWCGLERDPLATGAFGPRVPDILRKPTTVYVQTGGAGRFAAQLSGRLVNGLPRLLDNPIGQLRELLVTIDLRELEDFKSPAPAESNMPQLLDSGTTTQAFVRAKNQTLQRLGLAEQVFLGQATALPTGETLASTLERPAAVAPDRGVTAAPSLDSESRIQQLLASAQLAVRLENYAEGLKSATEALELPGLEPSAQAELWLSRGVSHYFLRSVDEAVGDWSRVLDVPGAPVGLVALALNNRGATWGQKGDTDRALADHTRVIEQLPDAPVEQVAIALLSRGVMWGQKGETDRELADYTRVIEQLPDAPVEQVAKALLNRGVTWGEKGDTKRQLDDYTRLIEQLPDAPVEQVARALGSRGWAQYKRGGHSAFLTDTEAALRKYSTLGFAAFNLGLALLACGRDADALVAYRRAGEQFPQETETGLGDLEEAKKTWLTTERAKPMIELLRSLAE